jgi:hypothetical protein
MYFPAKIGHFLENGASKLQDEIKTEKFELNKFHASDPFY